MSLDENGILYVASAGNAIYRMFPWSNSFELFAGSPDASNSELARDGERLGNTISGPVRHMDAIGYPGHVYALASNRSVLCISTEEGGVVSTVPIEPCDFIAAYPDLDKPQRLFRMRTLSGEDSDPITRFFHPCLILPKPPASPQASWFHQHGTYHNTSGDLLWDSLVYPLATLAPNVTICVYVERDQQQCCASLGVVFDASLSTLFNSTLHGIWKTLKSCNNMFLFSPSTNMMYAWNDETKILMRYYNVVSSFTLDILGVKKSSFSTPKFSLDLSPLRSTLPFHDFKLENKPSGQSWNVHTDVLSLHMTTTPESIAKLRTLISSTKIPPSSISTFIDLLYLKLPTEGAIWIQFISELCHLIFLCEAVDVDHNQIAHLLKTQISTHMSPNEAADMLFGLWFDPNIAWSSSSTAINLLAAESSKLETSKLLDQLKSCERPLNGVRAMEIAFKLTSMGSWQLPTLKDPMSITMPDLTSRILVDPKRFLQSKTDFAFGFDQRWTIAKGWVLYPRWSWFKRLIDSGMEESKTHLVSMPLWVTSNIFYAIILTLYQQSTGSSHLSHEEMVLILEKGSELNLVDESKCAVTPFDPLIARCKAMLINTTTLATCLRMLKLYHRLGLGAELESTIKFIVANKKYLNLLTLDPELQKLIEGAKME